MLFQVLRAGRVAMFTESAECIPSKEELALMKASGYTFKMDGKAFNPEKKVKKESRKI